MSDSIASRSSAKKTEFFRQLAHSAADLLASSWAFFAALVMVVGWAISGPFFGFSENWQLVINTSTTIFTFLAVFLLQNAQNRDTRALHLKLDELIRAGSARNRLIHLESLTDEQMDEISHQLEDYRASRHPAGEENA